MNSVESTACAARDAMRFEDSQILSRLEEGDRDRMDEADFGIIVLSRSGELIDANRYARELSGLASRDMAGRPFFSAVAPCMNNDSVAGRLRQADSLDETLDYVFTTRVKPTPVRLRLLKGPEARFRYLLFVKP
jgi:photoactive yellow protein